MRRAYYAQGLACQIKLQHPAASFLPAIVIIVIVTVVLLVFMGSLQVPTSSERVQFSCLNSSQAFLPWQGGELTPVSLPGLLLALD